MDTVATITQLKLTLWELSYNYWKTNVLFTPKWWSLIITIVIFYIVWYKLAEKRRMTQILLFGALISIVRITIDIAGTDAVLWSYDIKEAPLTPNPFLHDFTITPLIYMLAYQFSSSWKMFSILNILSSGVISFVFLPLLSAFDFLTLYRWNFLYTFVLLFLAATLSRAVVLWTMILEERNALGRSPATSTLPRLQPAMKPESDPHAEDRE